MMLILDRSQLDKCIYDLVHALLTSSMIEYLLAEYELLLPYISDIDIRVNIIE